MYFSQAVEVKFKYIFLLVILCLGCKSQKTIKSGAVGIKYDCELVSAEFDELQYMDSPLTKSAYKEFQSNIDEGVFFTSVYFNNSKYSKAIVLDSKEKDVLSYTMDDSTRKALSDDKIEAFRKKITQVESGSFRQVCYNGPSEGSMSLLLVKSNGKLILKYEASQYNYTHLNESEKVKIENALELIHLLEANN